MERTCNNDVEIYCYLASLRLFFDFQEVFWCKWLLTGVKIINYDTEKKKLLRARKSLYYYMDISLLFSY